MTELRLTQGTWVCRLLLGSVLLTVWDGCTPDLVPKLNVDTLMLS